MRKHVPVNVFPAADASDSCTGETDRHHNDDTDRKGRLWVRLCGSVF